MTERGLRWFVLGLAVALATGLLAILFLLSLVVMQSWSPLFLVEDAAGLTVAGLGLFGFWTVRRGGVAHGPAHASSLRRATVALVLTVLTESSIFITGILLGYGILPHVILISKTYPQAITLQWILQTVHFSGYVVVSLFAGLFLLWTVWQLIAGVARGIAVAALVVGLPTPIIALVSISSLAPFETPVSLYRAFFVLPALSVSLWLVTYLLAILRLRAHAGIPAASAAST